MKTLIKKSATLLSITIITMILFSNTNRYEALENDFIGFVKNNLASYTHHSPEDRVYLHFDKPFYKPGETMWFSAYVRNGKDMKASIKSDIVNVEFISPKGTTEKKLKLIAKDGKAAGDFALDPSMPGGMYTVKAYTNWQKNEGEDVFFEKKFQVQKVVLPNLKMKLDFDKKAFGPGDEVIAKLSLHTNANKPLADHHVRIVANLDGKQYLTKSSATGVDGKHKIKFSLPDKLATNDGLLNVLIDYEGQTESISRSIPIVLGNIELAFFPEGGEMVTSLEGKVAFRALNEFNKPADIEGIILDQSGAQVATFTSFHQGMGAFELTPEPGEVYTAKITKPEGITKSYELPEPLRRGYALSVDNGKSDELAITVRTTDEEPMAVVAQVRGEVYYSNSFNAEKGETTFYVPSKDFPIGVAQFTLFDNRGIQRAERLAFLNKGRQLNIEIETDKQQYQPREKVKMTVRVEDERGIPMPANLSLAVVDDQLLSFADDKSGNLLSSLMLEYDIKEKIEEPAFYFDESEEKADQALDYLMLTSGWRRFTWKQVLRDELPELAYPGEKAVISGRVLDPYTKLPIANASVKAKGKRTVVCDSTGVFTINGLDLSQLVQLEVTADGYSQQNININDYSKDWLCYLYDANRYQARTSSSVRMNSVRQRNVPMMAVPEGAAAGAWVEDAELAVESLEEVLAVQFNEVDKKKEVKIKRSEEGDERRIDEDNDKEAEASKDEVGAELKVAMNKEIMDDRMGFWADSMEPQAKSSPMASIYYRAREFSFPVYEDEQIPETRSDFRSTVYWEPNLEVGSNGKKVIEFYNSDNVTSFRAIAEGISEDGMVGRSEKKFFTQLPFAVKVKIPVEVATTDIVSIPLTIKNNTDKELAGTLSVSVPKGLKPLDEVPNDQKVAAGSVKTLYLRFEVLSQVGIGAIAISFKARGTRDAISQDIKIVPKGFPVTASYSGDEMDAKYIVEIDNPVKGSITAQVTAFPSVVGDLLSGVQGILREPGGCFEQTSMSSYPNAMVLDYLQTTESEDQDLLASATGLLDRGYKRLTTFETSQKGYEWFGKAPAHEGLTAFGLMQFVDMKRVGGDVDQDMIDRTAKWIMSTKDGDGGFTRNTRAYHSYGSISPEVMNGYIVYALADAGYTDIKKEAETTFEIAMKAKDPYLLAMTSSAMHDLQDPKKAAEALKALLAMQKENGSLIGKTHSITHSSGQSLTIETTSLGIMAMLKSPSAHAMSLTKAVEFLVKSRSGYGTFGNTQGTVLALKALTEYAKFSKKTSEDGTIEVYVDGRKVKEYAYQAGDKGAIVLDGLGEHLSSGKHIVRVAYKGVENPLPYALAVSWNTSLPASDQQCVVDLSTKLQSKNAYVGETVRLSTVLTNKSGEGLPSTIAIIGIPAGLTAQPWQLKELAEKEIVDFYEVRGNNVVVYYRNMAPNEKKEINLDLKAEMPGEYDAPASSAYLYYTNEFKTWTAVDRITIKKRS